MDGLNITIIFNQVELFYLGCSTVHLYSIYRMWMVWAYTLNFDQEVEPFLLLVVVHLYSVYRMWMVWAYTLNFDQVKPVLPSL